MAARIIGPIALGCLVFLQPGCCSHSHHRHGHSSQNHAAGCSSCGSSGLAVSPDQGPTPMGAAVVPGNHTSPDPVPMPMSGAEPAGRFIPTSPTKFPSGVIVQSECETVAPNQMQILHTGNYPPSDSGAQPIPDGPLLLQGTGPKPSRAVDYSWIEGQLEYSHVRGGMWKVRYAPITDDDPHGGSVVLDVEPADLQAGETVRVEGKLALSEDSSSIAPLYNVQRIDRAIAGQPRPDLNLRQSAN